MKNIFVAVLIFIFVMCFFFIPHGEATQVTKAEYLLFPMEICHEGNLSPRICVCIVLTAQMPLELSITLNATYDRNSLLYGAGQPTLIHVNANMASTLATRVTVYKAASPRSFHVGK